MNTKKIKSAGFTVLELVIVMGIMAFLLTTFLTNFRGFENKAVLEDEADKIVSVIRQAQIMALTGQLVDGQLYNYGIHLQECTSGSCTYILFMDNRTTGDKRYGTGEAISGNTFNMFKSVKIDNNNLKTDTVPVDSLDIVFTAPLSDIYFNNSQSRETASIVLTHTTISKQITIIVNRISGQVNIQ